MIFLGFKIYFYIIFYIQLGLSGRDLFTFNPDLVRDDDDEANDSPYIAENEETNEEV